MTDLPPLHLVKFCVGVSSAQGLKDQVQKMGEMLRASGRTADIGHSTKNTPKRASEIVGRGSLYWIIKGQIACRQLITDIRPVTGYGGAQQCYLVLSPDVVMVQPRPKRPFQGWRYLEDKEAPPDFGAAIEAELEEMPAELKRELGMLGLL